MHAHDSKSVGSCRWLAVMILSIPFLVVTGVAWGEASHDYRALAREWMEQYGYAPSPLPADHELARFSFEPSTSQPRSREAGTDVELGGWESPKIAINPTDPLNIAVATYLSVRVSTDGGLTFGPAVFPDGTWSAWGPTSITFDSQGRLFWVYRDHYFDESSAFVVGVDVQLVQCDPNTGAILSGYPVNVTTAAGVPGIWGSNNDMPWIVADTNLAGLYQDRLYVTWTRFLPTGKTRIHTSFSTDQGLTWSSRTRLDGPDVAEGFKWPSHAAVASNGDVYVAYHSRPLVNENGQVFVRRSVDGGATFLPATNAFLQGQAGMPFNTSGTGQVHGTRMWLQGSAQPWVLTDPQSAARVYVIAADDPGSFAPEDPNNDPGDVVLAISTDSGATWEPPRKVDSGPDPTFQVMPTAAIDPVSGYLAVHYYDNRAGEVNGDGNYLLDVYTTVSRDDGKSFFHDFPINDQMVDPEAGTPCPTGCGPQLLSVWGSSATDVIAVGRGGVMLRYDGSSWTEEDVGVSSTLWDIWGSSASDVWVVGSLGRIMHWDGTSWDTNVPNPATDTLFAIWGNGPNDVFAVGDFGMILHWNGTIWTQQISGTTNALAGVWGSGASNVLAVGLAGTALRYNGFTWAPELGLVTTDWLWALWGSSATDITTISTTDGQVFHYDGSSWSLGEQLPPWTIGLWGFGPNNMIAVGIDNCHFDGASWTLTGATPEVRCVWGPSSDNVFAVGNAGQIWNYDGTTWTPMFSPVEIPDRVRYVGESNGIAIVNDESYSVWCGNWRWEGTPRGAQTIFNPPFRLGSVGAPEIGSAAVSSALRLDPVAPNPFGSQSRFSYVLPQSGSVRLVLHDVTGRLVTTLVDRYQIAGRHSFDWDATGHGLAAGVYFVRLESRGEASARRIVLMR